MVMAEAEICRHYRLALDPRADITILADLNLCDKKDIIAILQRNGVAVNPKHSRAGKSPKCNLDYIRKLHSAGMNDKEMAEAAGVKPATIWRYRQVLGLPRNIKPYTERHERRLEQWQREGRTKRATN